MPHGLMWVGIMGIVLGLCVAPPQLWKIIKTGKTSDISVWTYSFLVGALFCYLIYAISIRDTIFITAQSVNLVTNGVILFYLIRR